MKNISGKFAYQIWHTVDERIWHMVDERVKSQVKNQVWHMICKPIGIRIDRLNKS